VTVTSKPAWKACTRPDGLLRPLHQGPPAQLPLRPFADASGALRFLKQLVGDEGAAAVISAAQPQQQQQQQQQQLWRQPPIAATASPRPNNYPPPGLQQIKAAVAATASVSAAADDDDDWDWDALDAIERGWQLGKQVQRGCAQQQQLHQEQHQVVSGGRTTPGVAAGTEPVSALEMLRGRGHPATGSAAINCHPAAAAGWVQATPVAPGRAAVSAAGGGQRRASRSLSSWPQAQQQQQGAACAGRYQTPAHRRQAASYHLGPQDHCTWQTEEEVMEAYHTEADTSAAAEPVTNHSIQPAADLYSQLLFDLESDASPAAAPHQHPPAAVQQQQAERPACPTTTPWTTDPAAGELAGVTSPGSDGPLEMEIECDEDLPDRLPPRCEDSRAPEQWQAHAVHQQPAQDPFLRLFEPPPAAVARPTADLASAAVSEAAVGAAVDGCWGDLPSLQLEEQREGGDGSDSDEPMQETEDPRAPAVEAAPPALKRAAPSSPSSALDAAAAQPPRKQLRSVGAPQQLPSSPAAAATPSAAAVVEVADDGVEGLGGLEAARKLDRLLAAELLQLGELGCDLLLEDATGCDDDYDDALEEAASRTAAAATAAGGVAADKSAAASGTAGAIGACAAMGGVSTGCGIAAAAPSAALQAACKRREALCRRFIEQALREGAGRGRAGGLQEQQKLMELLSRLLAARRQQGAGAGGGDRQQQRVALRDLLQAACQRQPAPLHDAASAAPGALTSTASAATADLPADLPAPQRVFVALLNLATHSNLAAAGCGCGAQQAAAAGPGGRGAAAGLMTRPMRLVTAGAGGGEVVVVDMVQ